MMRKSRTVSNSISPARCGLRKGNPSFPFLKTARDDYQANVNQADFKTEADVVSREINGWVAQKTRDKIQNILAPGAVDSATRLVLANAIYFKGSWASCFKKASTSSEPFHVSENSQADAPLMNQVHAVRYCGNDDFQAIELPYIGGELSMVILLPRQINGLGQLEHQLSPAFLAGLDSQMRAQEVDIFLPRFKLDFDFKLNDTLAKMGMPDAFNEMEADFSGLNGIRDLFISGVFHKAWVEVNEEGTEAAAATSVVATLGVEEKSAAPVFRADHPFVFLIRDTRSGSLLFVGRLADPRV